MREKATVLIIVRQLETSMDCIPASALQIFSMKEIYDPNIHQMINE